MNDSGSLCPTIKASEIIGDKWTLLILRELMFGFTRYNQFQRALPRISPTVLSGRLKQMEANGLIIRKQATGQKGGEYRLTRSGLELGPIMDSLARWGLRWARDQLCDIDLDVGGFMWDFHRTLQVSQLPDGKTVLCVIFSELKEAQKWWMIADRQSVDLCNDDPGHDVDVYITGTLQGLASIWMGDVALASEMSSKQLMLTGERQIVGSAERWFPRSSYADVRPESNEATS
ncbi:putative HTH-type transcriptional regulator [Halioglobus japonicus]|nr:putative HTH-type transcriptional regulator [Halioglobus japonicus]